MKLIMIGSLGELKKGAWSPEEDQRLMAYVEKHGSKSWCQMPKAAGLARSGKSCRLRWMNYLRPDLKRGRLTMNEIQTIITLHKSLGNQWTKIAEHLPGRTDNEIKNFWYLNMKKNSKTITKKNPPIKSNKTKRENKKVNKENICSLNTYASDEIYSEMNSSASSSIIDFPIAESYSSPSKDSYSSSIKMDTIGCPYVCDQERKKVQDSFEEPFWIEDVIKSSMLFTTNFEDRSKSSHNAIDSQDIKPTSQFDESTSFWFNILINAEKLEENNFTMLI